MEVLKMSKYELNILLCELGVSENIPVSYDEFVNLEQGKGYSTIAGKYFKFSDSELSNEEIQLFLAAKSAKNINTIKNICIFFFILAVIFVAITLLGSLSSFIYGFSNALHL